MRFFDIEFVEYISDSIGIIYVAPLNMYRQMAIKDWQTRVASIFFHTNKNTKALRFMGHNSQKKYIGDRIF